MAQGEVEYLCTVLASSSVLAKSFAFPSWPVCGAPGERPGGIDQLLIYVTAAMQ
jgi:hypothetical protein